MTPPPKKKENNKTECCYRARFLFCFPLFLKQKLHVLTVLPRSFPEDDRKYIAREVATLKYTPPTHPDFHAINNPPWFLFIPLLNIPPEAYGIPMLSPLWEFASTAVVTFFLWIVLFSFANCLYWIFLPLKEFMLLPNSCPMVTSPTY